MDESTLLGKVVQSKSGRDKEQNFIIVEVIDSNYVYISDGDLRKIEKPKKKKLKHLILSNVEASEIRDLLENGKNVSNSKIRKFLQVHDFIEEV